MRIAQLAALLAALSIMISGQVQAKDMTLAKNGRSSYTIVLSKGAAPSEKHAADELQSFLFQISGARLPVVVEGAKLPKQMIVLGDGAALKSLNVPLDFTDLGDEGFVIKTVGPHLVIAGGRLRGTMYGVYTFLEDVLGCRWYSSYVSYIPKKPTITIKPLDITQKADFEYREPFYSDAFDADWAARNKANGNHAKLDQTRGGKVIYHYFVHSFGALLPVSKYFDQHPEYYSMINGKRIKDQNQLCMTNPEVVKIATETVMRWIEERPDAKIYSVSQNDWYNNCQCDKCKAVDEEEGSPSGLLLRFVNSIAEEVEKTHPDKLIDTLAYQWTEKPPKITKPRAKVRVRLCPISQCQHHAYEKCEQDAGFVENLRNWSQITDNLYIWHYNTVFPNYLLPLPDLEELAADVPMYKRFGVKGMFMQGTYNAGYGPAGGAGFMDNLKAYLLAKLLWNTKADPRAITDDFLNGYFGKAGKPIGQFLDLLHNKVRTENIHGTIWQNVDAAFLTPEIMTESERLFDEAEKLADSPEVLSRVKHARLSLEYVRVMREVNQVGAKGTSQEKAATLAKLEGFVKACEADGITQLNEWSGIRPYFEQLAAPLRK